MPEPPQDTAARSGPEASETEEGASPGKLLTALAESLGTLLAGKIQLLRLELSRDLADFRGTAFLLVGLAALLILAVVFAGAGAALLIGNAMGSPGAGFLVVAGLYLVSGLILLVACRKRLKRLGQILAETRADLKRDAEWLKNFP